MEHFIDKWSKEKYEQMIKDEEGIGVGFNSCCFGTIDMIYYPPNKDEIEEEFCDIETEYETIKEHVIEIFDRIWYIIHNIEEYDERIELSRQVIDNEY